MLSSSEAFPTKSFKYHMKIDNFQSINYQSKNSRCRTSCNAQQARFSHVPSDCAVQAHFDDFDVSAQTGTGRIVWRMETHVCTYLPIDDDLCRSHGGCTRYALLSRASLAPPPWSRIDRYYFRPVHDTRWIYNALPRVHVATHLS